MSLIQIILNPKISDPLADPVKIEQYIFATNFLSIFATFDHELI